jgi:hypothetical protein
MADKAISSPGTKFDFRYQLRPDKPDAPGILSRKLLGERAFGDADEIKAAKQISGDLVREAGSDPARMDEVNLISCSHLAPVGGVFRRLARAGATKPGYSSRCRATSRRRGAFA